MVSVQRANEQEQEMMQSVIKAKPMEFVKEEELQQQIMKENQSGGSSATKPQSNNWVNPQSSRVSKNNASSISRNV